MERVAVHRGEVWETDFDPVVGHEQGGRRPAVIVSSNRLHELPSALVMVVPVTSRDRRLAWHYRIEPGSTGLSRPSFVMCEQLRTLSIERLIRRRGTVPLPALNDIHQILQWLMDAPAHS